MALFINLKFYECAKILFQQYNVVNLKCFNDLLLKGGWYYNFLDLSGQLSTGLCSCVVKSGLLSYRSSFMIVTYVLVMYLQLFKCWQMWIKTVLLRTIANSICWYTNFSSAGPQGTYKKMIQSNIKRFLLFWSNTSYDFLHRLCLPKIILNVVLFPAPFVPINPKHSPIFTLKLKEFLFYISFSKMK